MEENGSSQEAYEKYCRGLQVVLEEMPKLGEDNPIVGPLRNKVSIYLERAESLKAKLEVEASANKETAREAARDVGRDSARSARESVRDSVRESGRDDKDKRRERSRSRRRRDRSRSRDRRRSTRRSRSRGSKFEATRPKGAPPRPARGQSPPRPKKGNALLVGKASAARR